MSKESERANNAIANWRLGKTSERYESSGRGAGIISTGTNDHGGVSYGLYQLSSNSGTLQEYLAQSSYGEKFRGLRPVTPAFDAKWREIARVDAGFGEDQHNFIGRSHYEEQLAKLDAMELPLNGRGKAVQDALWSTSVQFRDLTTKIVSMGLKEAYGSDFDLAKLTDGQIVEAMQDFKINHNEALFRRSPGLWPALVKRAHSEKAALLELAAFESAVNAVEEPTTELGAKPIVFRQSHQNRHVPSQLLTEAGLLRQGESGMPVQRLQQQLIQLGCTDAQGRPLKTDGEFGERTKQAVQAFQRAHDLEPDGIAGPRTQAALRAAERQLLTHAQHPHHGLFRNAMEKVHGAEFQRQIAPGPHSERLAAALTVEALREGLTRIDRVEFNDHGTLARAVQLHPLRDEPGLNRSTDGIGTQQASTQSILQSSQQAQRMAHEAQQPQAEMQRAQLRSAALP